MHPDTAVILCGGKGTRISEKTDTIPKPMLEVGNRPILHHIMDFYSKYGVSQFLLLTGYLHNKIEEYHFAGEYQIRCLYTGEETQTGGRIKLAEEFLPQNFYLTYGDGLSNVDLYKISGLHRANPDSLVIMTAVHPVPRFGSIEIDDRGRVTKFSEKTSHADDWINGGFMVMNKFALDYMTESCNLEVDVLPYLANEGKVMAHRHLGYWQCVDTLRDLNKLNDDFKTRGAIWLR